LSVIRTADLGREAALSLLDLGADATGQEDSSPAFARLMQAVGGRRQVHIIIPAGVYRLAKRVWPEPGFHIRDCHVACRDPGIAIKNESAEPSYSSGNIFGGKPSLHISRFRVKYAGSKENRAPKNATLKGLGPPVRETHSATAKKPSLWLTFPNKWLSWRGFPRARNFTAGRL